MCLTVIKDKTIQWAGELSSTKVPLVSNHMKVHDIEIPFNLIDAWECRTQSEIAAQQQQADQMVNCIVNDVMIGRGKTKNK